MCSGVPGLRQVLAAGGPKALKQVVAQKLAIGALSNRCQQKSRAKHNGHVVRAIANRKAYLGGAGQLPRGHAGLKDKCGYVTQNLFAWLQADCRHVWLQRWCQTFALCLDLLWADTVELGGQRFALGDGICPGQAKLFVQRDKRIRHIGQRGEATIGVGDEAHSVAVACKAHLCSVRHECWQAVFDAGCHGGCRGLGLHNNGCGCGGGRCWIGQFVTIGDQQSTRTVGVLRDGNVRCRTAGQCTVIRSHQEATFIFRQLPGGGVAHPSLVLADGRAGPTPHDTIWRASGKSEVVQRCLRFPVCRPCS